MPDKIVTLGVFANLVEAQLVKNRLEAEGIPVQLTGENSSGLFAGMDGAFCHVQLLVAEADLERACNILELDEEESGGRFPDQERVQGPTDTAIREQRVGGIRPARGNEPPPSTSIRPTSPEEWRRAEEQLEQAVPSDDDDLKSEELWNPLVWTAEALAFRAFRVAVIGMILVPASLITGCCLVPPLFLPINLYSLWLLYRLSALPEEVSPTAIRRMYAALAIDVAVLLGSPLLYLQVFFFR